MLTALLLALAMDCPFHGSVESRHDTFGFSHEKSRHTFRTLADGGTIELRATDPRDTETVAAIRTHLHSIADAFAKGDFSKPQFVHETMPDGARDMQRLGSAIRYQYRELPNGASVRIRTADAEALSAVRAFLRFQTNEHAHQPMP